MKTKNQPLPILQKSSKEILEEINYELSLLTHRFATNFLTDVFRSIFSVEKSLEMIEPRVFTVDDDPGQIIFKRLNSFQVQHLPFSITNDEVLCKNYKLFSDIDFAVFVDLSLSMLYRWTLTRDISAQIVRNDQEIRLILDQLRKTKLYALKYICCTFLYSSINNAFKINFVPFGSDILMEKRSQKDLHFPAFVLDFIDEHFQEVYKKVMEDARYSETPGLENALIRALKLKKKSILLFISDFLDHNQEIESYLFDLKIKHSLLVAVINDPYEMEIPYPRWQPLNKSWEHTKNIEQNIRKRVILSKENIVSYNQNARERRNRLLNFLRDEKIHHLDLVSHENRNIPGKLEKLNLDILQGL